MKGFIATVIIILILFGIICFGITSVFVHSYESQIVQSDNVNVVSKTAENNPKPTGMTKTNEEIPTFNPAGLYDENDLIIAFKEEEYQDVKMSIPFIQGLKNKDVENKINQEMYDEIHQKVKKFGDDVLEVRFDQQSIANFSNVISISGSIFTRKGIEYIAFNYEVLQGNKLTLEDIFTPDVDFQSMIRKQAFQELAVRTAVSQNKDFSDMNEVYDTSINEDQLLEIVSSFMNSDFVYSFNSSMITFIQKNAPTYNVTYDEAKNGNELTKEIEDAYYYVPMSSYADQIIVYDKFKGDYDIYERNDIGSKKVSPSVIGSSDFVKYGFEADNLWVIMSINISNQVKSDSVRQGILDYMQVIKKEFTEKRIKEYREMAKPKTDCFLVVQKNYQLIPVTDSGRFSGTYRESNIITVNESQIIYEIDKKTSKELDSNMIVGNLIATFEDGREDFSTYLHAEEVVNGLQYTEEENDRPYSVNIDTLERFDDYQLLFKNEEALQKFIRSWVDLHCFYYKHSEEELNQLLSSFEITFEGYELLLSSELEDHTYSMNLDFEEELRENFKYWIN